MGTSTSGERRGCRLQARDGDIDFRRETGTSTSGEISVGAESRGRIGGSPRMGED